ncbi:hypothetical protein [Arsenophonus endosymbiont of Aleurodicus floccissimus]|uniref:hypothetical protein n=1 Tax=Arsenophonus endosymbiont of Aleurodicus floccissimus TaxID=2152761 RepID=UPI000E6B3B72|nr:hypothetical protein [Arsenophonus endosymbiont of Aleurodicus floccissimus]
MIGDGRLEMNTDSLKNRGIIKVEGKNVLIKIKVNEVLDTYGNNIAASNGLIIDAQQLKVKDGNIKIINKNKNIKPVVSATELIDITPDEQLKFVNSNKVDFNCKM